MAIRVGDRYRWTGRSYSTGGQHGQVYVVVSDDGREGYTVQGEDDGEKLGCATIDVNPEWVPVEPTTVVEPTP